MRWKDESLATGAYGLLILLVYCDAPNRVTITGSNHDPLIGQSSRPEPPITEWYPRSGLSDAAAEDDLTAARLMCLISVSPWWRIGSLRSVN